MSNQEYARSVGDDSLLKPTITVAANIWRGLIVAVDVVAVVLFALALWNLKKDRKLRNAQKG